MLDLRFLARRKALTAIAVVTMALAIGANTAALSVLKAFLLSSLAVPEPDRVVLIAPERMMPGRGSVVFADDRLTALAIETSPADNRDYRYTIQTLRKVLLAGADKSALFVQAGAATLLGLAILDLASLLVAWGFERRQEMALRRALGAGSARVMRLLVQQSVIIVSAGAALGVALAYGALRTLQQFDVGPTVTVLVARARLDAGVLAATTAITIISGLAAGALPAWFSRGDGLGDALRASSRSATLSKVALRWQKAMVVGQEQP